jgi:ribosomal protein S18 acetylase RimI-like enzyme
MNYDKIVLEVRASNTRAINLYRKNNFEVVSCLENHYKNGEKKDDLFIMEKPL